MGLENGVVEREDLHIAKWRRRRLEPLADVLVIRLVCPLALRALWDEFVRRLRIT